MNYIKNILPLIFLLFSYPLSAQSEYNYTLASDYSITIHGGSNLHDWTETVGKVNGIGAANWNDNGSFDLNNLKLMMEASSITSTEGSLMNDRTHKTLKANKHPMITFTLTSPVKLIPSDGKEHAIVASSMLRIAGVSKTETLHVRVTASTQAKIIFEGSQEIKMSDFGIDPPTFLFGALRVTDEVTIQFKTSFTKNNN